MNDVEIKDFFADVKEMFKETDRRFKETDKRFKETDKKFKETKDDIKALSKEIRANGEQIKKTESMFTSQWGKLIESLVDGKIIELLQGKGILVERTSTRQKGNYKGENYEFDIIAHNGDTIVIVEVKSTLRVKHIKKFKKQLKQSKLWFTEYKNHKVYGAVAYLLAEEESQIYAENEGLWAIQATGDSASIINQPDFKASRF